MFKHFRFAAIVLLVHLCLPLLSEAQNFAAQKYGETGYQKEGSLPVSTKNGFLGMDLDAKRRLGYTIKLNKLECYPTLIKYDKSFNVVKKNKLSSDSLVFGPFMPFFFRENEKNYLLFFQQANDVIDIKVAEIDEDNLVLLNPKKIMDIDPKNVGMFGIADIMSGSQMIIDHSPDKKSLLFFWNSSVDNKFSIAVTTQNFDVIRSKTETIEAAANLTLNNLFLDDADNVFGSMFSTKKYRKTNFIFENTKKNDTKIQEVSGKEDLKPLQVYISRGSAAGEVQVCGTLMNEDELITGAFLQVLSKEDLKIVKETHVDFSEEFVDKFKADGYARNKKRKFGLYSKIDFKLVSFADGTIICAGDLSSTRGRTDMHGSTWDEDVKGSDLILIFSNQDIIYRRIPKMSVYGYSTNRNAMTSFKDKALLFYIDNEKNLQNADEPGTSECTKCQFFLVAATISKDGMISRKTVDIESEPSDGFVPTIRQMSSDSFCFYFTGRKTTLSQYLYKYSTYQMLISE